MKHNQVAYMKTPLGTARIEGSEAGISKVSVLEDDVAPTEKVPEALRDCVIQLEEYFKGKRTVFTLKLNPRGSDFQKKVWNELMQIPFGKRTTYMEQTMRLGNEKAIRAVAGANGKNPIWIIIPCHRVIGSDGSLTGYAGGLWRKRWLLEHESPSKQTRLF
jgi:methylated-DNA-[protein]-cysteine S-methyltransferase